MAFSGWVNRLRRGFTTALAIHREAIHPFPLTSSGLPALVCARTLSTQKSEEVEA
jgi:hypothetical protein